MLRGVRRAASTRKSLGRVADRRDLVGARRVREEPALARPTQLLAREPAHALHEAALDLAAVDARVQRVADVVEDVDAHARASCRCSRRPRPRSPPRRTRSSGRASPSPSTCRSRCPASGRSRSRESDICFMYARSTTRSNGDRDARRLRRTRDAVLEDDGAARASSTPTPRRAARPRPARGARAACSHAARTAAPLRSAPLEAAVADVFGHLVGLRPHHADRRRPGGRARASRCPASSCTAPAPSRCRRGSPARCRRGR